MKTVILFLAFSLVPLYLVLTVPYAMALIALFDPSEREHKRIILAVLLIIWTGVMILKTPYMPR